MELIKETVLEKLAQHKQTSPQTDGFIQSVQEEGVTYKREYIKDKVDRYIISQESSSEEKTHWIVIGDYDNPESYWEKRRCEWQQESRWDTEMQSWQTEPTKITVTKWTEFMNGSKEDTTSRTLEGDCLVGDEERGFGILWNFCLIQGEREFRELKKAGYTPEQFKGKLELQRRIAKAKEKVRAKTYSSAWRALKGAVTILARNGEKGKAAARELIRIYQNEHQR